jgi:curved DNA-binding protein CbpA
MSDHYELLGVAPSASAAEIRRAYALLAREKHPDRFTDPAEKERAQKVFQDITTAFNTLIHPDRRREYDQERERPQPKTPEEIATDAFERAQGALEAGQVEEAITLLQTAVHHAPDRAASGAPSDASPPTRGRRSRPWSGRSSSTPATPPPSRTSPSSSPARG